MLQRLRLWRLRDGHGMDLLRCDGLNRFFEGSSSASAPALNYGLAAPESLRRPRLTAYAHLVAAFAQGARQEKTIEASNAHMRRSGKACRSFISLIGNTPTYPHNFQPSGAAVDSQGCASTHCDHRCAVELRDGLCTRDGASDRRYGGAAQSAAACTATSGGIGRCF